VIYKRYFISEIMKSAAAIFLVVVIIYASDCAINYMAQTLAGSLPPAMVGFLILLRVSIALEVILPVTFFLAVIIAMGRLYKDLEMTAFSACGLGMDRVLRLVCVLSLPVALAAAFSSLHIRPHAWAKIYRVMDEAQTRFDISRLSPNAFLEMQHGKVVFFAEEVQPGLNSAQKVFVRVADGDGWKVIRARQMIQEEGADGRRTLLFEEGSLYEPPSGSQAGKITHFTQARYPLPDEMEAISRYRRKATATPQLVGSARLEDITELQWRLSAPLSTVLLALLGVPLSKSNPRQGKFARIAIAIVIFAVYFQLFVVARTWVDTAVVPPMPGIWWVPALLTGLTLLVLRQTGEVFHRGGR
jgi:lipopolysaccharide export system permease protein